MGGLTENLLIVGKDKDLGDGLIVRRSLPDIRKRMVGPFVFWDHMGPVEIKTGNELKVRSHPHIGLATITYLFAGEILHRDTLGNEQMIRPGEMNWMTAGKGIAHSERSQKTQTSGSELEGIQLWLALPKESEEVDPSFVHLNESDLPEIKKDGSVVRLIAGEAFGEKSPLPTYSPLFYCTADLEEGANFVLPLPENHEGAMYVISGEVSVEAEVLTSKMLMCYPKGKPVAFKASADAKVMIFGGEVFPEGRHLWWNFVSSSKERIEQAKQDWLDGKFGEVINETEFIPLPEN